MMKTLRSSILITLSVVTSLCSAQCPDSTVIVYSSDFELNDGGLEEGGFGDWEYGDIPTMLLDSNCTSTHIDPIGAHSGTKGWGTVLLDCYENAGDTSSVALTVDLSHPSYTAAQLVYWNWLQIFTNFDFVFLKVNGEEVYRNDSVPLVEVWTPSTLDLTPWLGLDSVTISFHLFATTVVNKAGWYLDDLTVTACRPESGIGIREIGKPSLKIWPNPASGMIFVTLDNSTTGNASWVLYDASGRSVLQGAVNSGVGTNRIPVEGLKGMHILEWRNAHGVAHERVILQ